MSDTPSADAVNAYLASLAEESQFMSAGPIIVENVEPDDVRVRWRFDEAALRPGGYISGPTLFSIADLCGWILVFATEGIVPMAVTWDLHITFMRPAIGGDVIAKGRQLKRGRSLIYGDVEMWVEGQPEKPVAHATVTYALPRSDAGPPAS